MYTPHEVVLDYMTLSENEGQVGYPLLKKAIEISWYKVYRTSQRSLLRKWIDVTDGIAKYPASLEKLLGFYIVDSCGDLAALFEDTGKAILVKPSKKCKCNSCDTQNCLCPTIQDAIVQTDVVINSTTYTNKTVTRVLKNGDVVEETYTWVPSFNPNSTLKGVEQIISQTTKCKLDIKSCGCPVDNEENARKLAHCGCISHCYVPYQRERYPALYSEFGYYKKDDDNREAHLFDKHGNKSRLTQVEIVFKSSGADILVSNEERMALIALLDFTRKQYSPSFQDNDRESARRNWKREEMWMLKSQNPIPWEMVVQVSDATRKGNGRYYNGIHSDFLQPEVVTVCAPLPAQNITNIFNSGGGSGGGAGVLKLVVGETGAPVAGLGTYQNDAFIGLGDLSNGRVEILIDKQQMYNWGTYIDFDLNSTTGVITFRGGYVWQAGSTLKADLNQ